MVKRLSEKIPTLPSHKRSLELFCNWNQNSIALILIYLSIFKFFEKKSTSLSIKCNFRKNIGIFLIRYIKREKIN